MVVRLEHVERVECGGFDFNAETQRRRDGMGGINNRVKHIAKNLHVLHG